VGGGGRGGGGGPLAAQLILFVLDVLGLLVQPFKCRIVRVRPGSHTFLAAGRHGAYLGRLST
jgi:hypothetical protein